MITTNLPTKRATELTFISILNRDGNGVRKVTKEKLKKIQEENELYFLMKLSDSNGTYTARNGFTYVVKIKE